MMHKAKERASKREMYLVSVFIKQDKSLIIFNMDKLVVDYMQKQTTTCK